MTQPETSLMPKENAASDPLSAGDTLRLPYVFAKRFGLLLDAHSDGGTVIRYTENKSPPVALLEAQRFARQHTYPSPLVTQALSVPDFNQALEHLYAQDSLAADAMVSNLDDVPALKHLADITPETEDLLEQANDAPVVRFINALLTEAIKDNASDIHLEMFEHDLVVRFRVDGSLKEMVRPKRAIAPILVSRIKVMAKLDISEKRMPQDGRFSLRVAGHEIDVRVSTIPSGTGERVVLRLLDQQANLLRLEGLGMPENVFELTRSILTRPHGVFLVTGPTGSGKTTTLYASLSELDVSNINIMTVEDPIEYNLSGISQTQVNQKIGMTFANGLKAMLRQDPDVIMIGEIRDAESSRIAIQSSLTGHFVMATLHTNTAVGAVTRLLDMGMESFLLSSTLVAVLAQRLVRKLCLECKATRLAEDYEKDFLRVDEQELLLSEAKGCESCGHTGFKGRTGIYEFVPVDNEMRNLIHGRAAESELQDYARRLTPSIREDGRAKILSGLTTVQEVLRVTMED